MNKKEFNDRIWDLKKWLEHKLEEKNLLSHSFGVHTSAVYKVNGNYYVDLCLDDYRTSYIRYCDFGVRRKKFLETLVGEELEYFMEKYIGMNVRLEKKHIDRLFLLRKIYD